MDLKVYGNASGKTIACITINETSDVGLSIMDLLINNNITIASSCHGEGKCHKCLVNNDVVSCQISVIHFIEKFGTTVDINYL